MWIINLLKSVGFIKSNNEGRQKIKEGAVKIDGKKVEDEKGNITISDGMIIQLGKKKVIKIKR